MHNPMPPRRPRRFARGILAFALALGIALAGGFGPVSAAVGTSVAAMPAPCRAADLDATTRHQGVTDTTLLHVGVTTRQPDTECTLMGQPQVELRDARGDLLVASPPPDPSAGGPVALSAGVGAATSFQWSNWCGPQGAAVATLPIDGPITVLVILPSDAGQLLAHPAGTTAEAGPLSGSPPCLAPDKPSELFPLDPFAATPGASLGPPEGIPYYVGAPFYAYWRQHGGLAIFGYPLSRELDVELEDGQAYTVQYFERARFEHHPENAAPDDVLLGQLGRAVHPADPPTDPLPNAAYFPQTGHNLHTGFRDFWEAHGGLAQFGYPLTEELVETSATDGKEYTVQYFERARFEWHPENAGTPYEVLLGQLGRQLYTPQAEPPLLQTPAAPHLRGGAGRGGNGARQHRHPPAALPAGATRTAAVGSSTGPISPCARGWGRST